MLRACVRLVARVVSLRGCLRARLALRVRAPPRPALPRRRASREAAGPGLPAGSGPAPCCPGRFILVFYSRAWRQRL